MPAMESDLSLAPALAAMELSSSTPDSFTPFRFEAMPAEIRNKVYAILLYDIEEVPELDQLLKGGTIALQLNLEPQILLVNKAIQKEAQYVLRKTNLLVRVTLRVAWDEIRTEPLLNRLLVLPLSPKESENFTHCVMTHEITTLLSITHPPVTFAFPARDLGHFVDVLERLPSLIEEHDAHYSHEVTVIDPYAGGIFEEPFFTQGLQEKLINPYRKLRGFCRFTIRGVSHELRTEAIADITHVPEETPQGLLEDFERSKALGNEAYRRGDVETANLEWERVLSRIMRLTKGRRAESLQAAGGEHFANQLAAIAFALRINFAQLILNDMRMHLSDQEVLVAIGNTIFKGTEQARRTYCLFSRATWKPSSQQVAKLCYKEAIAGRLIGTPEMLKKALEDINHAIHHLLGDPNLNNERDRIVACIKQQPQGV